MDAERSPLKNRPVAGVRPRRMSRWYLLAAANAIGSPALFRKRAQADFRSEWPSPRQPVSRGSDDPQFQGLQDGPRTVADAQLGEDVGHVVLHRALGHAQGVGDLLVAVAPGEQPQ